MVEKSSPLTTYRLKLGESRRIYLGIIVVRENVSTQRKPQTSLFSF